MQRTTLLVIFLGSKRGRGSLSQASTIRSWVAFLAAALLAGCVAKSGSDGGNATPATFRLVKFKSQGSVSKYRGNIPEEIKLTLSLCALDETHLEPLAHSAFLISNPHSPNREITEQRSSDEGCFSWDELHSFNYAGENTYIEQVREIEGVGSHHGKISYRFAFNPWEAADKGALPLAYDLSAGEKPPKDQRMALAAQALQALAGDLAPSAVEAEKADQSARLFLDNVKVSLHKERERASGPVMGLSIQGIPKTIKVSASGSSTIRPMQAGEFTIQPSLIVFVPGGGAGEEKITPTLMHDPLPPQAARVEPTGEIVYHNNDLVLPFMANQGQLYLALRVVSSALSNAKMRIDNPDWNLDEYEALYRIGPATELTFAMEPQRVAHSLPSPKPSKQNLRQFAVVGKTMTFQSYHQLIEQAQSAKAVNNQIDDDRKSNPYYPQTRNGIALNRVLLKPLDFKYDNPLNQTPTERDVRFVVSTCVVDSISDRPVRSGIYRVHKINGDVEDVPADKGGCLQWKDIVHHKTYDIEHYFLEEYRIVNQDLDLDEHITVALNPWDYGWTLGRDVRHLLSCNRNQQLAKGLTRNNFPEIGCMEKKDLCREGFVPLYDFNTSAERAQSITCVNPQEIKKFETTNKMHWTLKQAARPTFFIAQYGFSFVNQDFQVDSQLNLNIKRQYTLQMRPRIRRQDSLTRGIQGSEELSPGPYWLRVVLMRNRQDPAGKGSQVGEPAPVAPEMCASGENGTYSESPDWDYIDKWEGVVEMVNEQLIIPVEFDFADLYMLGARNYILFQITPLDYHKSQLTYVESPQFRQQVVDMNRSQVVLDYNSGLVTPTYRSRFIPVLAHGTEPAAFTCQDAKQIIESGLSDRNREQLLAPPEKALAMGVELFTQETGLKMVNLSEDHALRDRLVSGLHETPMPIVSSRHTPKDLALKLQGSTDSKGHSLVDLSSYRFSGEDIAKWIHFYPPGHAPEEDFPGPDPIRDYQVSTYNLLRNLCTYWRSGQVYPDMFGASNPFIPPAKSKLDWFRSERSRRILRQPDPCDNPESLLYVDKKVQVRKVDPNGTQYLGGQSENYNVAKSADASQKRSEDSVQSMQDNFSWKVYDVNLRANFLDFGIPGSGQIGLGEAVRSPLDGNMSFNMGVSRNFSRQSTRGSVISRASSEGSAVQDSTYLIVMKMDLSIKVDDYDHCVAIKPRPQFFNTVQLNKTLSVVEEQQLRHLGLYVCLGLKPGEVESMRLFENYFFIAQHFNLSHLTDGSLVLNRPLMQLIRGWSDYLKFKKEIEQRLHHDKPYSDFYGRSTRPILSATFLPSMSEEEKMRAQSQFDQDRDAYTQQSFGRYPSYPGIYTVFPDPNYGHPLLFPHNGNPDPEHADCAEGLLESSYAFASHLFSGPFERKPLACAVGVISK